MTPPKTLYILTGPPGSGKTTRAKDLELPVYDTDLGNKAEWINSQEDCILCTAAPSRENKVYWSKQARIHGFLPILRVMWVDRFVAMERMLQRDGSDPTKQNTLNKGIERWYRHYSPHPDEERLVND